MTRTTANDPTTPITAPMNINTLDRRPSRATNRRATAPPPAQSTYSLAFNQPEPRTPAASLPNSKPVPATIPVVPAIPRLRSSRLL